MKDIHTSPYKRTIIFSKYFYCLQQLEKYMEDLNESNFKMQDLKTSLLRISSKGIYKDTQKNLVKMIFLAEFFIITKSHLFIW